MGSGTPSSKEISFHNDNAIPHGRRLLPIVVEELATTDPDHILGMAAKSANISLGFDSLTVSQLSRAVNYTAHWLDFILGEVPAGTFLPIAFIGTQDFRYWVIELAAIKTSRPMLLPSTSNALPNTISLLSDVGTKTLFYTSSISTQAHALQNLVPDLTIHEIPTLNQMLITPTTPYPYTKTYDEAKNDQIIIVHTSGSTGAPKPIYYTNAWIRRIDSDIFTPPVPGRQLANLTLLGRKKLNFLGTPFFHLSGIVFGFTSIFPQSTIVFGPPNVPVTANLACEIAKNVKLAGLLTVPSLLDRIFANHGQREELQGYLGSLEHILWFGGPLANSTGDWIVQNMDVVLWQILGSTEMAWFPLLVAPKSH